MERNYSTRHMMTPMKGLTLVDPVTGAVYEFGDEVPPSSAAAREFRGQLQRVEVPELPEDDDSDVEGPEASDDTGNQKIVDDTGDEV